MRPDERRDHQYSFEVSHKWSLPGVKCPACGWTGAVAAVAYPSMLLPPHVDPKPYQNPWPVPPERIDELKRPLAHLIPSDLPFGAGTEFGPLVGKCRGKAGKLAWANYRTPIISAELLSQLNTSNLHLEVTKTEIQTARRQLNYFEIEIRASAKLDPEHLPKSGMERCQKCGILKVHALDPNWAEDPVILRDSIPIDTCLTRVEEIEGLILATENFRITMERLRIADVEFFDVRLT